MLFSLLLHHNGKIKVIFFEIDNMRFIDGVPVHKTCSGYIYSDNTSEKYDIQHFYSLQTHISILK